MPSTSPRPSLTPDATESADARPFSSISDLDAIAEVARGNREMFEVIVGRYNQLLYRVGMAYLHNHAHVEDAMQNTYVKAFLHLNKFERGAAFSTWITRIMINECLMTLRRGKQTSEMVLEFVEHGPDATQPQSDPHPLHPATHAERPASEQISLEEMKALLEKAVAALPQKYRAVYMLREIQQLSTSETAAALGVSSVSVKVDLHRARERLKAELLKSAAGAELFSYPAFFCDGMTGRTMSAILALS
jgi:RNA polymerase sigma factor (sigma-70 family)